MKIYHVTIYTTDGGQRRLYFPNYENAIDWALSEKSEMDDVDEVWLCVINPNRTGSYGSCEIEENQRIM